MIYSAFRVLYLHHQACPTSVLKALSTRLKRKHGLTPFQIFALERAIWDSQLLFTFKSKSLSSPTYEKALQTALAHIEERFAEHFAKVHRTEVSKVS